MGNVTKASKNSAQIKQAHKDHGWPLLRGDGNAPQSRCTPGRNNFVTRKLLPNVLFANHGHTKNHNKSNGQTQPTAFDDETIKRAMAQRMASVIVCVSIC